MKTCPSCGAENFDSAAHCSLCLEDLGLSATSRVDPSPSAAPTEAPDVAEGSCPYGGVVLPAAFQSGPADAGRPGSASPLIDGDRWEDDEPAFVGSAARAAPPPSSRPAGVSLSRALHGPLAGFGSWGKLLLALAYWLIPLAAPATVGYLMSYVGEVGEGHDELPDWGIAGGFLAHWLRGLGVSLLFGGIILGPSVLAIRPAATTIAQGGRVDPTAVVWVGAIWALWALVASAYLLAAIADLAVTDDLGAFAPGRVWRVIAAEPSFFKAWGISAAIVLGANVVVGLLVGPAGRDFGGAARIARWLFAIVVGGPLQMAALTVAAHLTGQWIGTAYGRRSGGGR